MSASTQAAICQYEEFLDHNELELACDALETGADGQLVGKVFWIALRDAARKMKLLDRAARYEANARNLP